MKIEFLPVAYVQNSRKEITDDFWGGLVSEITLTDDFSEKALNGIEDFSHAEIIFYFDKADKSKVIISGHPRGNKEYPEVGIFVQRKKDRPNHIGLTSVKILKREGKTLFVTGLDAINGTPVLDIKPVLKEFLPKEEIFQPEWASDLLKNYWKNI